MARSCLPVQACLTSMARSCPLKLCSLHGSQHALTFRHRPCNILRLPHLGSDFLTSAVVRCLMHGYVVRCDDVRCTAACPRIIFITRIRGPLTSLERVQQSRLPASTAASLLMTSIISISDTACMFDHIAAANALRHRSQVTLLLKVTISLITNIPHSSTSARYHTRWYHSDILQFN